MTMNLVPALHLFFHLGAETVIVYGEVTKLPVAKQSDWPLPGKAVKQLDSFMMQIKRKCTALPQLVWGFTMRLLLGNGDGSVSVAGRDHHEEMTRRNPLG